MIRLTAAAFAALLATSAFASDHPRYSAPSYDDVSYGGVHASFEAPLVQRDGVAAPSYDDVSYGGVTHASFKAPLVHPDGVSVVGSQYDDTRYGPAAEQPAAKRDEARVAETMPRGHHES